MLITKGLARSVLAACRKVDRRIADVDVGMREPAGDDPTGWAGANQLLWRPDDPVPDDGVSFPDDWYENDLCDTPALLDMIGRDIPTHDGFLAFDCYCGGLKHRDDPESGELLCNVDVLIDPSGKVVFSGMYGDDEMRRIVEGSSERAEA